MKSDFLHPTTRGGQIRTLEMLRRLHERNEIHYVAFEDPAEPEGLARASEYCEKAWPIAKAAPRKGSLGFYAAVAGNLFSRIPAVIAIQRSAEMRRVVTGLLANGGFDSLVCDFLTPAINVPRLDRCVLFQHNIETMIWRRHAARAADPLRRGYFNLQAKRMEDYERSVCRASGLVVAVSEIDAATMRENFGARRVEAVPTGVDVESFTPASAHPRRFDLIFVGSMDWMPNSDGMRHFARNIFPRIRTQRPDCTLAIVGRKPPRDIVALADGNRGIIVTGTVPDVKPYLWQSAVSIVPLHVGGGTRLKIFEAMAARVAVVSTTIGAEGLEIDPPNDIRIADSDEAFAAECLDLLDNEVARTATAEAGWQLVRSRFSWKTVTNRFEAILRNGPRPD
jgi:glycosyltransferase involved in cell wall biosynthesis